MRLSILLTCAGAAALAAMASGCDRGGTRTAQNGVMQTRFPGEVTSGGGTSGEILTRNAPPTTDGTYAGGTPGIAGGSGGNTGGAGTGGTVQESGQGPSQGTTQPASVGRPGAELPPGDHGKPTGPNVGPAGGAANNRDNPAPAAPGR
ncbi:MAG: hypothetical protein ACJ8LG_13895 [Massilia sp.]